MSVVPEPDPRRIDSWPDRDVVEIFEREREESLAEEGRILVAEVASLVLVLAFVLARMIWLV